MGFFGLGSFLLGEVGVFVDSYVVAVAVVVVVAAPVLVAVAVAGGHFLKLEPWNFSSLSLPSLAFSFFLYLFQDNTFLTVHPLHLDHNVSMV